MSFIGTERKMAEIKKLSNQAFMLARDFLKNRARPLERALFEYRFEDGPDTAILVALTLFQNEDGGFGNALEPDVRTPASSALATGIALNMLKVLGTPYTHPLVADAVGYLTGTFDYDQQVWRVVPPATNESPHAPWWHDEEGSLARTFDNFQIIPRAQLVGLLHHYAELVDDAWLAEVTEASVASVELLETKAFGGGGDTLAYALSLAETEMLPEQYRARLLPRLREVTEEVVSRDPEEWDSYVAPPLKIAPLPTSPVADLLGDDLQRHLDYVIADQEPGGYWQPSWSWGDAYPTAWQQAEEEWRGVLTLDHLTSLHAFGRLPR